MFHKVLNTPLRIAWQIQMSFHKQATKTDTRQEEVMNGKILTLKTNQTEVTFRDQFDIFYKNIVIDR